jgi:RNA polymerase sigma-70 factor (ECF subfamily)
MIEKLETIKRPLGVPISVDEAVSAPALGSKTRRRMQPDKMTENTKWVDCMSRISAERDRASFAAIFDHFGPRIKAFLIKSGSSVSMAEECTQDVMITLWRKAEMFDPSRASVATWIFTIARNRRIDLLRKERRPEPEELTWGPEADPEPEELLGLQQESMQLVAALATLPDKQRELIQKAYFGDLTHAEIASETGLPLGTIKSRIRLALERLRHNMKRNEI